MRGLPGCARAARPGGLRPCRRLAGINNQIPWICGVFGRAAPVAGTVTHGVAGRRPAAVCRKPRRRELPGAAVLLITAQERRLSIAVQTPLRRSERRPLRSCLLLLCFELPSKTLPCPPRGRKDAPALPQNPPRSIPWGERCCLPGGFESPLPPPPTPRHAFGAPGEQLCLPRQRRPSYPAPSGLAIAKLGQQHQDCHPAGVPAGPRWAPGAFLHPMPFPSLFPAFPGQPRDDGERFYPV